MTYAELLQAKLSLTQALNDTMVAEARINALIAEVELEILRHPDNPTNKTTEGEHDE